MTCKDCIHYEVCVDNAESRGCELIGKLCCMFKNKSRIIELPCKVGDKIYVIDNSYGFPDLYHCAIIKFEFDGKYIWIEADCFEEELSFDLIANEFNRYWFFDKHKADAKLKELSGND